MQQYTVRQQQEGKQGQFTPASLEMTDGKPISDAVTEMRCHSQDSEQRNVSDTDAGEEEKCTNTTWLIPSVQELEEVLHSAPRSCRHYDEVWPNLYLGDM